MSKSTCQSRLSSTATTPDIEFPVLMETTNDLRRQSSTSDRRTTNVNYVRNVLRKFFGGYGKKYSTNSNFDEISSDTNVTPILVHPCLQFEKKTKFSGKNLFAKRTNFDRFSFYSSR